MAEHNELECLYGSEVNIRQDLNCRRKVGLIINMNINKLSRNNLSFRTHTHHPFFITPYVLFFYGIFCLISTLHAAVGLDTTSNSHHREVIVNDPKKVTVKKPVTVMWGVADTTTAAGVIFKYRIPKDAFRGDVDHFEVSEAGKKVLPHWLYFDNRTNTFIGIPTSKNSGQQYIAVIAKGASNSKAKDVFSINVVDNDQLSGVSRLKDIDETNKAIICRPDESLTIVSVIADLDIDILNPLARIDLLSRMKKIVNIEEELFKILPLGDKPMYDSSAIMAGPGNAKAAMTPTSVISWQVGCGGNVDADYILSLTAMESTALDGSMAETISYPILGWQVTTIKPPLVKRQKRQSELMSTAVFNSDDDFVVPTKYELNTETIEVTDVAEDSAVPDSRVIPVMASPSFSGDKTKHHRPVKTHGRHHKHHKTDHITPTKSYSHLKSKAHAHYTPFLTPIIMPTYPTRLPIATIVVPDDIEPTHEYPVQHITPTHVMPTITIIDRIQPSILPTATYITHPKIFTEPTPGLPTRKPKPPKKTTTSPTTPRLQPAINHNPVLINPIDHINAVVGEILRFQIPVDTFRDKEDGDTSKLKLVLLTLDGSMPSKGSWVQFNATTQELYGLPMKGEEARKEYLLAAIDSSGASIRDVFSIQIHKVRPPIKGKLKFNHKFIVKLSNDYENFTSDSRNRIRLSEKLVSFFGDANETHLYVHSISRGSTIFAWSNYSLPMNYCPKDQIQNLIDRMVKDGEVSHKFKQALRPDFFVEKADAVLLEDCLSPGPTPSKPHIDQTDTKSDDEKTKSDIPDAEKPKEKPTSTSDDDVYITTVIPAVVIAAMLIIAALIACILYRKKRKGKLSDEDKHTFINKGIPIIFADELEEKPEKPSKSPVILKDEKPPLPPPEYPRSSASSSNPSTPPSDRKEAVETTEDEHDPSDVNASPPYQPPPPFTTNRENRQSRPKHQPTYRLPPPYVPP